MATSPSVGQGASAVDAFLAADRSNLDAVTSVATTDKVAANSSVTPVATSATTPVQTPSQATTAVPAQTVQQQAATEPQAPAASSGTAARTTTSPTMSVEGADGTSSPVQVTNSAPITGAAGASSDPATNAAAQKMLASVDAELATRLGSKYKAPANQQERAALVAQVANGLKGAEKTAFLNKLGELGKDFGLNFGQSAIKTSTANLSTAQMQINAALAKEVQDGKASNATASGNQTASSAGTANTGSATNTGAAAQSPTQSQSQSKKDVPVRVQEFLATVKSETREQTYARFKAMDRANPDGKLDSQEWVDTVGMHNEIGGYFSNRMKMTGQTVDQITDAVRKQAGASAS